MIVDKVRNATTSHSAVHYEVTLRIWPDDLEKIDGGEELLALVIRAINGISSIRYAAKI